VTNMPTPPRRRWYQFSLRTMFLLLTFVAAPLAYHLHWIRQRHQFLVFVDRNNHNQVLGEWVNPAIPRNSKTPRAPWLLWLFGEPHQSQIVVSIDNPDPAAAGEEAQERMQTAKRLFPEATINTLYMDPNGRTVSGKAP
jgi:hypothetical protein